MITLIKNIPDNIIGFRYEDHVTAEDYEIVLFPAVNVAKKKSKDLKILCQLADNFKGFSLGALKDDMEVGLKYFRDWKKIALLSNKEWMNDIVKAFSLFVTAQVRTFQNKDIDEAIKWLSE
jgi:hypothetical protein